jgi:hypothetical protein
VAGFSADTYRRKRQPLPARVVSPYRAASTDNRTSGASRSAVRREDRRVVLTAAGRRRQERVRAQDDLIDDRAVLALLDPDRVRAGRREVHVHARHPPSVVGPAPPVIGGAARPRLQDALSRARGPDCIASALRRSHQNETSKLCDALCALYGLCRERHSMTLCRRAVPLGPSRAARYKRS